VDSGALAKRWPGIPLLSRQARLSSASAAVSLWFTRRVKLPFLFYRLASLRCARCRCLILRSARPKYLGLRAGCVLAWLESCLVRTNLGATLGAAGCTVEKTRKIFQLVVQGVWLLDEPFDLAVARMFTKIRRLLDDDSRTIVLMQASGLLITKNARYASEHHRTRENETKTRKASGGLIRYYGSVELVWKHFRNNRAIPRPQLSHSSTR
jgi:hypothetical protein